MSPVLFNVYIDDLSKTLHSMPLGCYINNMCVNHLVYADDMVLLMKRHPCQNTDTGKNTRARA